jgi:hypothetical protein
MPALTDQQYADLMRKAQTADFVESIWNNPQFSNDAKALVKKAYPNLEIPGFDQQQYVDKQFADRDHRAAEDAKRAREAEEDRRWKEERARVQQERGFTDDTMKEIEQAMVERKIGDYEAAADHYAARHPKTSDPADGGDHFWNYQKKEGWGDIAKDPEGWARKEILGAIRSDQARARQDRF